MMKKNINYAWPVKLTDFSPDNDAENFSRGKLEVFYKGETEDHRYLSDAFSESLIQSLPYTPVVSYYDEEKQDFVGHATEQQILGIVDPCREISFKKDEDGKEWCVCDVVLYTERPDKVGEIAKKIIGHKQSMELDPKTTKYVINYDDKKHFKNIEFTAGRFVGVSVLGDEQTPAFAGSHFFTTNGIEEKMKILREYCEHNNQEGGEKMNLQEFMKLSWGDVSLKVEEQLIKEYAEDGCIMLVDMFDDAAIVRIHYYVDNSQKLMRVHYSINEETEEVELGQVEEVHVTYEPIEQPIEEDKPHTEDLPPVPFTEEIDSEPEKEFEQQDVEITPKDATDEPEQKVSVEGEKDSMDEKDTSSTSFTEGEREELETLKREKKIALVNSYKENFSEEVINDFMTKVDDFSEEQLELELLKAYKANQEDEKPMRAFAYAPVPNTQSNATSDILDSFVRKYKR